MSYLKRNNKSILQALSWANGLKVSEMKVYYEVYLTGCKERNEKPSLIVFKTMIEKAIEEQKQDY